MRVNTGTSGKERVSAAYICARSVHSVNISPTVQPWPTVPQPAAGVRGGTDGGHAATHHGAFEAAVPSPRRAADPLAGEVFRHRTWTSFAAPVLPLADWTSCVVYSSPGQMNR